MKISPTALKLDQLLGSANEQFVIPPYQRRYSWRERQVYELLEDLDLLEDPDVHSRRYLHRRAPRHVDINPRTTLLDLVPDGALPVGIPERLRRQSMTGSAFKLVLALDRAPRFRHARDGEEASLFSSCQFRIAPSCKYMDRAHDDSKYGETSRRPMMWGLCPTLIDTDMAVSGRHMLSVNVWHAPHELRQGSWTEERDRFGDSCVSVLEEYMPGLTDSIVDRQSFSPVCPADEYGLVESNVVQGDVLAGRMFSLRPMAGMSDYRTPVAGLNLCGTGTWPGGFVSGIPGHNTAHALLADVAQAEPRQAAGGSR